MASNVTELCSGESHKQTDRQTDTTKIVVTAGAREPIIQRFRVEGKIPMFSILQLGKYNPSLR